MNKTNAAGIFVVVENKAFNRLQFAVLPDVVSDGVSDVVSDVVSDGVSDECFG
jgi:hypothetical protein